jgi:hypothetical protein
MKKFFEFLVENVPVIINDVTVIVSADFTSSSDTITGIANSWLTSVSLSHVILSTSVISMVVHTCSCINLSLL